jgi:hypothetical protein
LRQQRRVQADRPQQIGRHSRLRIGKRAFAQDFRPHNAGIVNDDVEGREIALDLLRKAADRVAVLDIERRALHSRIGRNRLVERRLAAARDDDLVALGVKSLGECAADAGAAAGNQDRIATCLHVASPRSKRK